MLCITFLVSLVVSDCYLAYPKGSNNRLNEKSANRQNANRLFDSQNNNRGGYNVGELHEEQGFDQNDPYATDDQIFNPENKEWKQNSGKVQFEEPFIGGSEMRVTYTVQHGCGNPKNNCNMVFEYTCDTHDQDSVNVFDEPVSGLRVQLKNGGSTATPNAANTLKQAEAVYLNNNAGKDARSESEEFYALAKMRKRNEALFTADQKIQGNDQTKTRQNPGGTRRGLEVPEERDYFPWWNPTPWRPLFITSNNVAECEKQMADLSAAVEPKTSCVPKNKAQITNLTPQELTNLVREEDEDTCTKARTDGGHGGHWVSQKFDMPKPACLEAVWSQANNLGNVKGTEDGGLPQTITWKMPTIEEMAKTGCHVYTSNVAGSAVKYVRFQTRLRYNMTTMDYDPYKVNSTCNQDKNARVQSPVQNNPTVDIGVAMQGLRLALNTAQTGRTFQDRSHVMRMLGTDNAPTCKNILNVNVQGKRGNIVQTYPAVEYDFWPRRPKITVGDCISFQWTGSNTHNNGNPAGDGQAGDAGEGRGGSDRSNLAQLLDMNSTFPVPLDKISEGATDPITSVKDFFSTTDCFFTATGAQIKSGPRLEDKDVQAYLLSGGFYTKMQDIGATGNADEELNVLLNNAPASLKGVTCRAKEKGFFAFTSTRNNNFSNRDQKLTITVE